MADTLLAPRDYARYQRWVERAFGTGSRLEMFDAGGNALFGSPPALERLPWPGAIAADEGAGAPPHRVAIDAGRDLLCVPLRARGRGRIGWAGVLAPGIHAAHAAEVLADVASDIVDQVELRSDLLRLTEELGQCYEELSFVYDISHEVQSSPLRGLDVFEALVRAAAHRLDVDLVAFVRPRDRTCVHAELHEGRIADLDLLLVELAGDLFRFVVSSAETVVINAPDDPRRAYILPGMRYRLIASPVRSQETDGLLVLINDAAKRAFTNGDRRLGEVLASQLSNLAKSEVIIRNMGLFTSQLAAALVEAIDAKDPYTRGHSERVNGLAIAIANEIGLDESELESLHWGSLLHDVGKIAVPDPILTKPGPLTEDELRFVRLHPERSHDILSHVEHLREAMPGVLHHHEMFDGRGYPEGLRGEAIPLPARIIAVADTYDSITSSRAYRPAGSHDAAMREIERVAGAQLDPALVDVFRKVCAAHPARVLRSRPGQAGAA